MAQVLLILGGARSGKSFMAERMAREKGKRITFVATGQPGDDEMRGRIEAHRAARPAQWTTIEEPLELARAVEDGCKAGDAVLVDCLTLWVSNRLCSIPEEQEGASWTKAIQCLEGELEAEAGAMVAAARKFGSNLLLVSNEVGLGVVPDNALGRAYRDLLGRVNRRVAQEADQVLLMVAGLAVRVKPGSGELP